MMASIFTAMQDPQVPDEPPAGQPDSNFQYRYYKNHYFDNIDFSDARLLRSPVYHKKLKMYMKQLTAQQPDSVIKAADYVLDKASADKEIFKYSLVYLLNTYSRSKIMGMDKVFVHLVENYYNKGKAYWADSSTLSRLRNRARTLKPTLVGKKAPNIILPDSNKTHHALHELNAKYTILCFWDPGCSHCKDAIPKLDKYYEKVQDKGVVVYAANTQPNTKKWKKFINKHDLNWINVHDPNFNYRFRSVYDIQSTPKIYLLDENKKIIAKQLSVKQLKKLLNRKLNQ